MNDETHEHQEHEQAEYEAPAVEDLDTSEGPAVTVPGGPAPSRPG